MEFIVYIDCNYKMKYASFVYCQGSPSLRNIRKKLELTDDVNIFFKQQDGSYTVINENDIVPRDENNQIRIAIDINFKQLCDKLNLNLKTVGKISL